jgi:hypothetical protein
VASGSGMSCIQIPTVVAKNKYKLLIDLIFGENSYPFRGMQGYYLKFLLKLNLKFSLRKTGASLNNKIELGSLHTSFAITFFKQDKNIACIQKYNTLNGIKIGLSRLSLDSEKYQTMMLMPRVPSFNNLSRKIARACLKLVQ